MTTFGGLDGAGLGGRLNACRAETVLVVKMRKANARAPGYFMVISIGAQYSKGNCIKKGEARGSDTSVVAQIPRSLTELSEKWRCASPKSNSFVDSEPIHY